MSFQKTESGSISPERQESLSGARWGDLFAHGSQEGVFGRLPQCGREQCLLALPVCVALLEFSQGGRLRHRFLFPLCQGRLEV